MAMDGDKALRAGRWEEASKIFRRILAKDPESILAYAEQAETLRAQGRVEEAEELVAAGLTIDREYLPLLIQQGNDQWTRKDWKGALESWEKVLKQQPDCLDACAGRATALSEIGNASEALRCLEAGLQAYPRNEWLLGLLGQLLLNLQKWDQALVHIEAALQAHPRSEWLLGLLLECCTEHVKNLRRLGHFDEAAKLISHALGRFPANVPLRIARAEVSSLSRDWEATARHWQAVIEVAPDDDRAHWELAEALRKLKRENEADAVMAGWLKQHPDYPSIAPNAKPIRGFSQLGQDLWVLEQTNQKTGGYFVEFGACDGVFLSNTYLLEKSFGWTGICVEPNRELFHRLIKNRNCLCLQECVFSESGKTLPFLAAGELGTLQEFVASDSHGATRARALAESYAVSTISLNDLLEKALAPPIIDYLSVDTEGSEYEILRTFDFKRWIVRCWTIEHNYTESRDKIAELMTSHGYRRIAKDWDDWFYLPANQIDECQGSASSLPKAEAED
jgi:FkbM family methyltransferase